MEKKYQSNLYNLDAQASGLVGFFDADCGYVIEEKIVNQLIICNKVISSYDKNIIKATAKVGEFNFNFNIYIQDGVGGMKRAGLFIVEKCKLGAVNKDLETYLDSIVAPFSPMFMEEVKKKYHLFTKDESTGVDIDINNQNLKELISYLTEIKRKYKVMLPIQIPEEKKYIDNILKALKEDPVYGPAIIKEFKEKLAELILKKQNSKSKGKTKGNLLTQNQLDPVLREARILLDNIINNNRHLLAPVVVDKIDKCQENLVIMLSNLREPIPMPTKEPEKKKKKEEKKKDDDKKKKKKKKEEKKEKKPNKEKPAKDPQKSNGGASGPAAEPKKAVPPKAPKKTESSADASQEFSMFGAGVENKYDIRLHNKKKNKVKDAGMER